ncbi:hypothetical protein PIROE2DRAFT_18098 [Piromyces sp. E2]|nr:hypothetical protein PIROE2DRAFT_18098 [Piromyces sp. E2]|eukprot:OUM57040.1 hypothetical protein PIROE2DRAFT_18098 [Piromyces sp. E2]
MGKVKRISICTAVVVLGAFIAIKLYNSHFVSNLIAYKSNLDYLDNETNLQKDVWVGGTDMGKIDIFYNKKDTKNLKPVVFFIHGGGWIIGDKHEYSKIGYLLMKNNYVAILPNYILFPRGTFDDMVEDIYRSILWTYSNIEKYGGDRNKIILIGYSSGAHLTILTVLKSYLRMKNNGIQLKRLPWFEKVILLNGPYDFDDYDTVSNYIQGTVGKVEHGFVEQLVSFLINSEETGPTDILKSLDDNSIENFGTPEMTFFYCDADTLIHESSAVNLIKEINRVSPNTTVNYVYDQGHDFKHYTLTLGARTDDKEKEQMFLDLIKM